MFTNDKIISKILKLIWGLAFITYACHYFNEPLLFSFIIKTHYIIQNLVSVVIYIQSAIGLNINQVLVDKPAFPDNVHELYSRNMNVVIQYNLSFRPSLINIYIRLIGEIMVLVVIGLSQLIVLSTIFDGGIDVYGKYQLDQKLTNGTKIKKVFILVICNIYSTLTNVLLDYFVGIDYPIRISIALIFYLLVNIYYSELIKLGEPLENLPTVWTG